MAQYVENMKEEEALRAASMQCIYHTRELQALAAARTRANALAVSESNLRRQTLRMSPYMLSTGAQCRISYRVSSTVRQQLKVHIVKALSPQYTRELYRVTARHSAPGRSELYHYDLRMVPAEQHGAAVVGGIRVQLPQVLYSVDRRYLMPVTADVMHSLSTRLSYTRYATSMFGRAVRDQGQGGLHKDANSDISEEEEKEQ